MEPQRAQRTLRVGGRIRDDIGYRIGALVSDAVILEIKSVDQLNRVHEAQLLPCLKLARVYTGPLINFNVRRLAEGIRRFGL